MKALQTILLVSIILLSGACKNSKSTRGTKGETENQPEDSWFLDASKFRTTIDGKATDLYLLTNKTGIEVYVTNFGAIIPAILVPDRDGNMEDIVLGFDNVRRYTQEGDPSFGCVVGRYANRIGDGKFELDGKEYNLVINETSNNNQLHGGPKGISEHVWETVEVTDNSILLKLESPDGDMGYPGNLTIKVRYTLTENNSLEVDYYAVTDAPTPINLTQHTYFNLNGEGNGDILGHELLLNADYYTPVTSRIIPTGEIAAVEGTPMDFRTSSVVGDRINEEFEQLVLARGYDHNWVLNGDGLRLAAELYSEESGRFLEVLTTEPGIQVYCGNFLDGTLEGKSGAIYEHRFGICLETQHFPDSPNQPGFPNTILMPGEEFKSKTVFRFTAR